MLQIGRATTYVRVTIAGAARKGRVGVHSTADRSISHHLASGISILRVEATANAALEHLVPRILNLIALVTLLVDHILLELEMVAVLARQTIDHALLQRYLLTHRALALLCINALHHHFIWLLAHLLVVWVTARIHHGARQKLWATTEGVTLMMTSNGRLSARVLLHLLIVSR